jgi:hypothetical protein
LVNLKNKSAGDGYLKKAIEKTVLRFLGSRTFPHGLDPLPTFVRRMKSRLLQRPDFTECILYYVAGDSDSA